MATQLSLLCSGSFLNADGLLSFPCDDGRGLRPWRVGGVLAFDLLLLGSAQWRCPPFSPPLTAHSLEMKEEKTPKGLVAWAPGSHPLLAFEAWRREHRCESPRLPGFDCPGGRGGTALLRAGQVAGARGAGANEENPALAGFDSCARVRASPPACGPVGRGGRPMPRAWLRRESPGAVRIRGGGRKVRIGESG
jgi:hypothetical protein